MAYIFSRWVGADPAEAVNLDPEKLTVTAYWIFPVSSKRKE